MAEQPAAPADITPEQFFEQLLPAGFQAEAVYTLDIVVKIVVILIPLFVSILYVTWLERVIIGRIQNRIGPNRVTFFGISWLGGWGQPIADAVKLITKEIIIPSGSNKHLFELGAQPGADPKLRVFLSVSTTRGHHGGDDAWVTFLSLERVPADRKAPVF